MKRQILSGSPCGIPGRRVLSTATIAACTLIAASLLQIPAPASAQTEDAPRRGDPITLNFSNADIEAVARTMAVVTGRDVVVDPRVKGTMSLITDQAVAPNAAFDRFTAALRLQGFVVVETNGLYKVVPEAEAKLQPGSVPPDTVSPRLGSVGGNQIVTQIFRLNHESPNALLPVLRPLISPNNTINANPGNNSLVITDYADNLRRLARIIASLDLPNASDIEVIKLRHSIATDVLPLINKMIDGGGAAGAPGAGGADASFRSTLQADSRSNTLILRAANPARAALIRSLIEKIDKASAEESNGPAGNIYTVHLQYADAVRLAATLRAAMTANAPNGAQGAAGGGTQVQAGAALPTSSTAAAQGSGLASANAPLNNANQPSTGGQIQADPSTNSLIITAPEPQYRQLRAVIDTLDKRRAQIMIEALIVEVNADKAAEFGVQWQNLVSKNAAMGTNFSNKNGSGVNVIDLALALASITKKSTPIDALAKARPGNGLNLGIGRIANGRFALNLLAHFLENDGEGNVLSTPNVMVLDNQEAKIVMGENVPFVSGSYASTSGVGGVNPFTTIERKDVGLSLRVRPQTNVHGTVMMTITQETSAVVPGSNGNNGPTTTKRLIETQVLVEDGSIIMLGGMLKDEYSNNIEKVPLAGDIPVLGNLFKSEARLRKKSNLMVFLRPVVLRDAADSEDFSTAKYEAARSLQQATQPDADNPMLRGVREAPVLPPMERPQDNGKRKDRRIVGTNLFPSSDTPPPSQQALPPGVLRGALPPTADPSTARELP